VLARSGDTFEALVDPTTYYQVLTNLDLLSRDWVEDPGNLPSGTSGVIFNLKKYIVEGRPVFVSGIYQENGGAHCFEAQFHWGEDLAELFTRLYSKEARYVHGTSSCSSRGSRPGKNGHALKARRFGAAHAYSVGVHTPGQMRHCRAGRGRRPPQHDCIP